MILCPYFKCRITIAPMFQEAVSVKTQRADALRHCAAVCLGHVKAIETTGKGVRIGIRCLIPKCYPLQVNLEP